MLRVPKSVIVTAWLAGLLTLPALLVLAVAGTDDHVDGEPAPGDTRYFNLPDGKAQIAVSTRNQSDIVVRWRDADGRTWTDPEVVHDGGDLLLTYRRIRVGGPTLALFATFTPRDTHYHDEIPAEELAADDVTVFVVCRDGSCSASDEFAGTLSEPPQVTPDGSHVFLAAIGSTFLSWHGDGIVEREPSGLPEGEYGAGQPLLAPDGSLRAVRGEADPEGCDFTLLTTEPGGAAFMKAARYQDPGDRRELCATTLETFSSDYLVVGHGKYAVWFLARTRDKWRRVVEDPSGQVRYPRPGRPKLAGVFERSGFWHWREVIGSSPDGRTLVVQVHFPGEETWRPPQVVARAPKGSQCIFIDPMPTYTWGEEDPFYINLRCRSRPSPGEAWVYSYPTAVTDDGKTWHSFLASDSGARVGRDLFFRGRPSHRWSPESGLQRVDLPVPPGAVLTGLGDGGYALSSLVEAVGGCTVEVRLAGPDDSEWSDPVRSTADPVPERLCALDMVQNENRNVYHYFGRGPREHRMVRLVWRDGQPVLENGPR